MVSVHYDVQCTPAMFDLVSLLSKHLYLTKAVILKVRSRDLQ